MPGPVASRVRGPVADRVTGPSNSLAGDLRLVVHELRYEQLAFWLNPVGALFTVGFSIVFVALLGAVAGGSRVSFLGNIRLIPYYAPGTAAYGVMAACFTSLSIALVNRRQAGLLERLRLSPLPTWTLLGAVFASTLLVALVQVVVLLTIGWAGCGVALPKGPASLLVSLVVGGISFPALGVAMSTAIPNPDAAGPGTVLRLPPRSLALGLEGARGALRLGARGLAGWREGSFAPVGHPGARRTVEE